MSYSSQTQQRLPTIETIIKNEQVFKQSNYKSFVLDNIDDKFVMPCINKCFVDFEAALTGIEKACLAKCMDRASDYHVIAQSELSPFNKFNQKNHLHQLDGISVRNLNNTTSNN